MAAPQLPPGQQLAAVDKWPVVGERLPRHDNRPWSVRISGAVARPFELSLADLAARPRVRQTVDIHCVTRWSKLGVPFSGVLLADLVAQARPDSSARFVSFIARSERAHSTSLVLREALELGALVALEVNGAALETRQGGPVRMIVGGRYFYKSLKWLERVELTTEDQLGYWERTAGYHNVADPWREQRYMAGAMSRAEARSLLESRDIAGRNLLSLEAQGRDLAGLNAAGALLRDADFRRSSLRGACFDRANLTNAHFEGADLRDASFRDADLDGANLAGADLRGACLLGASFCATSFFATSDAEGREDTVLDEHMQLDVVALEGLMPAQHACVVAALAQVRR